MGGEPCPHLRLGDRHGIVEACRGGEIGEPAEAVEIVAKAVGLLDLPVVEPRDRLLEPAIQEIAGPQRLAGARVARHQFGRQGEQLERIFALEPHRVERRVPGQAVEAVGQPLGQRQAAVVADADEALALLDAVFLERLGFRFHFGKSAGPGGHDPLSLLILSA